MSVKLKFFAARQPVKCDANSGKQVGIVGYLDWERLRVCGDVTVGRLSLLQRLLLTTCSVNEVHLFANGRGCSCDCPV